MSKWSTGSLSQSTVKLPRLTEYPVIRGASIEPAGSPMGSPVVTRTRLQMNCCQFCSTPSSSGIVAL